MILVYTSSQLDFREKVYTYIMLYALTHAQFIAEHTKEWYEAVHASTSICQFMLL